MPAWTGEADDPVLCYARGPRGVLGLGRWATGAFVTDPTAEEVAAFTRFQRASASATVAARLLEVYYGTDIRALLPAIRARTAVLHGEQLRSAILKPPRLRLVDDEITSADRAWVSAHCPIQLIFATDASS